MKHAALRKSISFDDIHASTSRNIHSKRLNESYRLTRQLFKVHHENDYFIIQRVHLEYFSWQNEYRHIKHIRTHKIETKMNHYLELTDATNLYKYFSFEMARSTRRRIKREKEKIREKRTRSRMHGQRIPNTWLTLQCGCSCFLCRETRPVSSQKASIALLLISYTRRVTSFAQKATRRPGLSPTGNNDDFYYCRSLLTRQAPSFTQGDGFALDVESGRLVNLRRSYGAAAQLKFEFRRGTRKRARIFRSDVADAFGNMINITSYKT